MTLRRWIIGVALLAVLFGQMTVNSSPGVWFQVGQFCVGFYRNPSTRNPEVCVFANAREGNVIFAIGCCGGHCTVAWNYNVFRGNDFAKNSFDLW